MSAPPPNLDHIHSTLISALRAVERGKKLSHGISVPPFGQSSKVGSALLLASRYLDEPFHAEQLPTVKAACRAIGLICSSENKSEVASAIFKTLARPHQLN